MSFKVEFVQFFKEQGMQVEEDLHPTVKVPPWKDEDLEEI